MMIAGTERRRQGCSLQDGKQWGINTGGAVRTSTLPIPFTNVFLAVASTSSEWCCPGCSATNTTVTTRAYQSNRPDVAQLNDVNWIIIGCQPQWGASGYAVTFPIAFNVVYNVLSIPQTTASTSNAYWGRFYITALNKNGFNVSDTGAGSNRWIAIGSAQPQWGYGNSESTQTFPIKFTNSVIGIYGSKRAINYEYTFAATSITNTNFFMSTRNSEGSSRVIACNWLAIGQQQTK